MREYDETTLKVAERVFEKGDEILAQRKKRAAKIRHISYTASGLCAALIVCFGVRRFTSSTKKPYPNDNLIASTETTSITVAETTAATTVAVTTSAKTAESTAATTNTTSSKNIVTASTTASTAKNNTAAAVTTTVYRTTSTRTTTTAKTNTSKPTTALPTALVTKTSTSTSSMIDIIETPSKTATTFDTVCNTSTKKVNVTTVPECPPDGGYTEKTSTTTNFREVFRSSTATIVVKKDGGYFTYQKQNILIEPERIGEYMETKSVNMLLPDSSRWVLGMKTYKIKDIAMEEAVAVRLMSGYEYTEEFYLFIDPNYKKNGY